MIEDETIQIMRYRNKGKWEFLISTANLDWTNQTTCNERYYKIDEKTYNRLQKILQEAILEDGEEE